MALFDPLTSALSVVREGISGIRSTISSAISDGLRVAATLFSDVQKVIFEGIQDAISDIRSGITDVGYIIRTPISAAIREMGEMVQDIQEISFGAIGANLKELREGIFQIDDIVKNSIKEVARDVREGVEEVGEIVNEAIKEVTRDLREGLALVLSPLENLMLLLASRFDELREEFKESVGELGERFVKLFTIDPTKFDQMSETFANLMLRQQKIWQKKLPKE